MIKLTPDRDLDVIKVRAGRVPMLIIRQKAKVVSSTGRTEADGSIAAPEGKGGGLHDGKRPWCAHRSSDAAVSDAGCPADRVF